MQKDYLEFRNKCIVEDWKKGYTDIDFLGHKYKLAKTSIYLILNKYDVKGESKAPITYKVPEEEVKQLANSYHTIREFETIAKKYRVCFNTLYAYVKRYRERNGIAVPSCKEIAKVERLNKGKFFYERKQSGVSTKELANENNYSITTISNFIKEYLESVDTEKGV